ncbi:MAG: Fic family protein [Coriobacteriales bacterium]|nr:Fic family protein [Coriobacteriales bacterium]
MAYESLKLHFYKDGTSSRYQNVEELLKLRLEAESTFRTSIQTPSGELFLAVPRELSLLNEKVLRHERKIATLKQSLPPVAQGAMVRDLVINEVVSTNELEGVYSTRRQINELMQSDKCADSEMGVKRFRELTKLYLGLYDQKPSKPTSLEDIRSIYDKVMDGEPLKENERPDGKIFRKDKVEIIGRGGKTIHEGLYPESKIIDAMERMLAIANSEEMPETFSSIVAHFVFEYVHPFYDGNGRTGRYLLALYLSSPLSILTSLSLSRVIAENRDTYYCSFRDAEHQLNHGELTQFVMNILELVMLAQGELDEKMTRKAQLLSAMEKDLDRFKTMHKLGDKEVEVVYMLAQLKLFATFPEASQEEVADYIKLSKQQSRVYTKALEAKGIIGAVNKRPLRFALSDEAARELGLASVS